MIAARKCRRVLELRRGFTLVELLVVIGIIALLISILLPTLASARRSANSVKCLASLKEIGNALRMYAIDHKGVWPVAVHAEGSQPGLMPPGTPVGSNERRWPDLLAKYVSGSRGMTQATDIAEIRRKSVIWGCPEWTKTQEYDPSAFADKVRVGYGMTYVLDWYSGVESSPGVLQANFSPAALSKFAYIRPVTGAPNGVGGEYRKQTEWGRKGSERAVIMDSVTHIVNAPASFSRANTTFQPFVVPGGFYADATRHLKPGASRKTALNSKGMNILYADGHAGNASVVEAWNATVRPGEDHSSP